MSGPSLAINGRFLAQPITGVQRVTHELLKVWGRQGGDKELALLAPSKIQHAADAFGIPVRQFGRSAGHVWEQFELPWQVREDVLFCPGNTAPLATLLSGKPVVATIHDLSYRYFPTAYSKAFRAAYGVIVPAIMKRAAAVITVSETERDSIVKYYPEVKDRITAVPNGVFGAETLRLIETQRFPAPCEAPYVLYVGSLSKRKNFDGFIRAFALLPKEYHAVLAGAMQGVFTQSSLDLPADLLDRVHFTGQIDQIGDLLGCYQNARCFVFPSFFESSGLPPLEAMVCGCPTVVSRIPAHVERCGEAALYCDPAKIEDIAEQTRQLLEDGPLRTEMIRKGRERAALFTWENAAEKTWQVIEQAAS